MHKLMEYVCDELDELERKADKDGKLSMAEVQYADMLTNMKKNMLKMETMDSYSMADNYRHNYSRKRDAMGRYSRRYSMAGEDMVEQLRDMMEDAPDEMTRKEFEKFIHKVEQM